CNFSLFGWLCSRLFLVHFDVFRNDIPALLLAYPPVRSRSNAAGVPGRQLEFDLARRGRVEVIDAIPTVGTELGAIDVSALGNSAPVRHFSLKLDRISRGHQRDTERAGGQFLALPAMTGNHSQRSRP